MNEDIQPTANTSLDSIWRDTSNALNNFLNSFKDKQGQSVNDGVFVSLIDENVEGWISGESTELGEGGKYIYEDEENNQSDECVLDGCLNRYNEIEGFSDTEQ